MFCVRLLMLGSKGFADAALRIPLFDNDVYFFVDTDDLYIFRALIARFLRRFKYLFLFLYFLFWVLWFLFLFFY